MTYKLLLIEDDLAIRDAIRTQLADETNTSSITECGTVKDALSALPSHPDLIIVDLGLPDGDGTDIIRSARADPALSTMPILVFTMFNDERRVVNALSAGANGYILKDDALSNIHGAIAQALKGYGTLAPSVAAHLVRHIRAQPSRPARSPTPLTGRESELLTFLAKGMAQKDCARLLDISPHTVANHVKAILRKLDVHSTEAAVFHARSEGWLNL